MTRTDLVVDSVTGVDVSLPVAGPGARSFAFLIDWHIRLVLALAWYVIAALLYHRAWNLAAPVNPGASWFIYVVAPPLGIYFLYQPLFELATRGRTPGKRMVGLQLVTHDGEAPGIGALLTRNVFRLLDSLPFAYAVGLVTTMITRENVRVGDLAAGTLLVYARSDATLPAWSAVRVAGSGLNPGSAEIAAELLSRWDNLEGPARRQLAATLLGPVTGPHSGVSAEDDATLRSRLERIVLSDST